MMLVQTDWLADRVDDPALRIFDCTTHLLPAEPGNSVSAPYRVASGRADYDQGHIPGAGLLDLQGELSDNTTTLRFMRPPAAQFAEAMARHGIGDECRVVLYSANSVMWATRVWWLLRGFGFDNAAILDGGLEKWRAEGRPLSTEPCRYPPARFTARPRPELFVDKNQVLAALNNPDTVIVNTLSAADHAGTEPSRYGRPGRIPGSVNVPYASLIDPERQTLVSPTDASRLFSAAGIEPSKPVIAYCGGGISATVDLFLLHQLGCKTITLYDGSLGEWARDDTLPIETD